MAKRTIMDDLLSLGARLPWKLCVALAIGSGIALHAISLIDPPVSQGLEDISSVVFIHAARTLGLFGQFLIPTALLFGAVGGYVQKRRGDSLLYQSRQSPSRVSHLSWQQFEQLTGALFHAQGYDVQQNLMGGPDGGVDAVLRKGKETYLVQCKQWRAQKVGLPVIRELLGAMTANAATGGFVVTTGEFTSDAKQFATGRNIILIDGKALALELKNKPPSPTAHTATPSAFPRCPICASTMVKRTAKRGKQVGLPFWGCERFPNCRGTRNIDHA